LTKEVLKKKAEKMKKYEVVGREGCSDFPLILEEETLFSIEAASPEEVAKKLGGIYVKIEGEDCVLLPNSEVVEKFVSGEALKRFNKWWKRGIIQSIGEVTGKIFIIKN
jgi:hypothetical protein